MLSGLRAVYPFAALVLLLGGSDTSCQSHWQEPFGNDLDFQKNCKLMWRVLNFSGQQQVIRNTTWSSATLLILGAGLLPSPSVPQDLNY